MGQRNERVNLQTSLSLGLSRTVETRHARARQVRARGGDGPVRIEGAGSSWVAKPCLNHSAVAYPNAQFAVFRSVSCLLAGCFIPW